MKRYQIKPAGRLEGIGEYWFSQKLREIDRLRKSGRDIINLGVGSPDLPPHGSVTKELQRDAQSPDSQAYQSYRGLKRLRDAFSVWYRENYSIQVCPDTEILPLIGSKEGIMHICMAFVNPGDGVLIPDPGYAAYRAAAVLSGGNPVTYDIVPENGYQPDYGQLQRLAGTHRIRLMFVNYPHMPTGASPETGTFARLADFARCHDILLVNDNPYSFIRNREPSSLLSVRDRWNGIIELNSLSKSHNMPGWRVGAAISDPGIIDQIVKFKSNMDSGMFRPLQNAAAAALELDRSWYDGLNDIYFEREKEGKKILDVLGCRYAENQCGLFLWAGCPEGYPGDGYTLSDRLLHEAGVFVTPGGIFGSNGERFIRISLCADVTTLRKAAGRVEKWKNYSE